MQNSKSGAKTSQIYMHIDRQPGRWNVSLFDCMWTGKTNLSLEEQLDGMITANETHGGIKGKETWVIMKTLAITQLVLM